MAAVSQVGVIVSVHEPLGWKYEAMMERGGPKDVRKVLHKGKMELLGAYCLGDEECTDYAWSIFADAIGNSKEPQATQHWIGWQYADLGFFADAAEALRELCSRFNDDKARRLLAEEIWWRDNAHRIPWIPPAGDGWHYDHMMHFIDPSASKTKEEVQRVRNENQKERIAPYRPSIDPQLAKLFETFIPNKNEGCWFPLWIGAFSTLTMISLTSLPLG